MHSPDRQSWIATGLIGVPNSAALGLIVSLAAGVARIVQQRGGNIDATTIAEIYERITAAENVAAVTRAELQTTIGSTLNGAGAIAQRVASIERTLAASPIATHRLGVDANGNVVGFALRSSEPVKIGGADWEGVGR